MKNEKTNLQAIGSSCIVCSAGGASIFSILGEYGAISGFIIGALISVFSEYRRQQQQKENTERQ
jgi:membrane associated rhomboid family serine protease